MKTPRKNWTRISALLSRDEAEPLAAALRANGNDVLLTEHMGNRVAVWANTDRYADRARVMAMGDEGLLEMRPAAGVAELPAPRGDGRELRRATPNTESKRTE